MTAVEIAPSSAIPPDSAAADVLRTNLEPLRRLVADATPADVERALTPGRRLALADFAVLLSAPAASRLEELAVRAHATTVRRFGRTMHLFAPLYLSNECVSVCTYCGFSAGNEIARRTLSVDEVDDEARALVARGFRHLLLVSGEHARIVNKDYLAACVERLASFVPQLSIEVQVWDIETYERLVSAGCDGLVVYQETYDRATYAATHLKGKKRNYEWRLAAADRGAMAGMRRLGIGVLLGLHDDWRADVLALGVHATALVRRHWRAELSIALPRLRPAAGGFEPAHAVTDRAFVQMLCALRLLLPDAGLSLSTREDAKFRDGLTPLGVTQMSAGSHTEPGGYATPSEAEPQFEVSDQRTQDEVANALRRAGYEPVWKDWQRVN